MYNIGIPNALVGTPISAISKYHITDVISGLTVGKHPLVTRANKAFWQLKPPVPNYQGTYDVKIILTLIESLGENKTLTLKQLSLKTAFLVVGLLNQKLNISVNLYFRSWAETAGAVYIHMLILFHNEMCRCRKPQLEQGWICSKQ